MSKLFYYIKNAFESLNIFFYPIEIKGNLIYSLLFLNYNSFILISKFFIIYKCIVLITFIFVVFGVLKLTFCIFDNISQQGDLPGGSQVLPEVLLL